LFFSDSGPTARRLPDEVRTLGASVREAVCDAHDGVAVDLVLISGENGGSVATAILLRNNS
jgi:hypothetical protein